MSSIYSKLLVHAVFLIALIWSYWPVFGELVAKWSNDPEYSHGFLVIPFALFVLYQRRSKITPDSPPAMVTGLAILLLSAVMQVAGTIFYFDLLTLASLLAFLLGWVAFTMGRRGLYWAWPAIGFLAFMFPLPFSLEVALARPLQRIATVASTFLMQTLGLPAIAEGNIISLSEVRLNVVEACSGLAMLMVFFGLSFAFAYFVDRPIWQKVILVVSAIPIALISNVLRISLTGVLHETVDANIAEWVYHDLSGWLMMPMALVMLWIEIVLLDKIFILERGEGPSEESSGAFLPGLNVSASRPK